MNLCERHQFLSKQIHQYTAQAQRKAHSVRLIAVSKTFPARDIETLYHAGQRDFGENYIQEWLNKINDLQHYPDIVWHIIGQVQSNKSRAVAQHAHWLHSLDSAKLADRLNRQRPDSLPPLNVLIEINITGNPAKHGIVAEDLPELARHIVRLPRLSLRGLMCVAQADGDDHVLRKQFQRMQFLQRELHTIAPCADTLSMGMSQDLRLAIEHGATMVRIGSALFGTRPYTLQAA